MVWVRESVRKVNSAYFESIVVGSGHAHPHSSGLLQASVVGGECVAQAVDGTDRDDCSKIGLAGKTVMFFSLLQSEVAVVTC
jgi:hypothetical protein